MRIAYLGQMADVACENGISKKIRLQAIAWMAQGHDVRYFALTPQAQVWDGLAPLDTCLIRRGTLNERRKASLALCAAIRGWNPDLIYFRYAHHEAGLPSLFTEFPVIGEINSDDSTEYKLTLPLHKRLYHSLTRKRVLRKLAALVPVTEELQSRLSWLRRPACVIANSLALADSPQLPVPCGDTPRSLFFIGNTGSPWHGLERIGELARLFPSLNVDVVGCSIDDWNACSRGAPPANLKLHGMLGRNRYQAIMERASIAIGSMALYKNSMQEACPLKVREYLSMGLPVIAAYKDTDIPDDADYFLRLPNSDAPLEAWESRISAFITHWAGRRVQRECIAHLDVSVKEKQRLEFMARILAMHRSP